MQIKIDGYKNLKTPYLLKKGDFVCCGERITDGKTVLLRITDNRVIWSMDIDVIPEHLIVTENLDVFFTAQGMLYRAVISKNYVETLCADLGKEMNMNRIYTDGAKILYAKENGFNSFRWFLYDSRTDEERFIIEADRCVGFASDGDIIVTYPHYELKPANSYKMKKVNIKTLEVERFMPFMRVNDPVILNDEYIIDFRCESKYNTLYPFVYLVSIKKSVSISIDGIRATADRQYSLINDIFIWR
ncbi:MAG: hypothetical protein IJB86_00265 [Clostridia bacterium]|nr:hypothetical protein [Clostridia bacterium]